MGQRRGGGKGREGANGAAGAGALRDEEEAAAAVPSLAAPLLAEDDEEQQQQPLLAPPPSLRPKRGGSSSSCFLADGILGDGDGDANGGSNGRGAGGAGAASTSAPPPSTSTTSPAARRELARATHSKTQRRLAVAVALASGFMIAEVVGGALANSLAIMSDAAHLLSDVAGMGIALAAGAASARRAPPGSPHTYGHHRAEVLGALASTAATWAVTAALVVAAVGRLRRPESVDGGLMFAMAVAGVLVNVLLLFVLGGAHGHGGGGGHGGHSHSHSHGGGGEGETHHHDHDSHSHDDDDDDDDDTIPLSTSRGRRHAAAPSAVSINLRGAWLHAAGDLLQSLGVAVAGAVVFFKPSWTLADPLVTLLFAVLVFATTKGIAGELLSILMEAAPARVDVASLEAGLKGIEGVAAVADLHVWGLSSGIALGTAHLFVSKNASAREGGGGDSGGVLAAARAVMEAHGVAHSTIQIEEEVEEGSGRV